MTCEAGRIYTSENAMIGVNSADWLPVDFTKISGSSSINRLGSDPLNNSKYHLSYACDPVANTFELNVVFESKKKEFIDKAINDGGNNLNVYEIGNNPELNLIN